MPLSDLEREMLEALKAAEIALVDLGACEDAACPVKSCVRALPKVRAAVASAERKANE